VNVTLDTLHLVFSAFGTVQKIATFEKQSGFQALVQYPDAQTAEQVGLGNDNMPAAVCFMAVMYMTQLCTTCSFKAGLPAATSAAVPHHLPHGADRPDLWAWQVRQSLDGRHIPKHLLDDTPNPPMLKITFSQHVDLNVKFQSHRSRQSRLKYVGCLLCSKRVALFCPCAVHCIVCALCTIDDNVLITVQRLHKPVSAGGTLCDRPRHVGPRHPGAHQCQPTGGQRAAGAGGFCTAQAFKAC
jgi:hypothetical protein